ncbi:MAG: right-handed parallel beta-helix repeat-containing protein [bacterium]
MKAFPLVLVIAVLLAIPQVPSVQAAAIEVRPGQSIQEAINRAAAGDTVLVRAGVYFESLLITKPLVLASAGPLPGPVLSGARAEPAHVGITVRGTSGVTIRGFIIQDYEGGGILLENVTNSTVERNRLHRIGLESFAAGDREAINLRNSDNNTVIRNEAFDINHNGVFLRDGSDSNRVLNSLVRRSGQPTPPYRGCGIQISFNSNDNEIRGNTVEETGRGIPIDRGSRRNKVIGNQAFRNQRYGVGTEEGDMPPLDNEFRQNVARDNGRAQIPAGVSGGFDLFEAPPVNNMWAPDNMGTRNF